MRPRRIVFISAAIILVVFQTYVLLNHSEYWTGHPERDIPLHLMWGLFVFLFVVDILDWSVRDALLAVLVVAFVFEACEMASEKITREPGDHFDHFYTDGFTDNIVNFIGGLFGAVLVLFTPPRPKTKSPLRKHFTAFLISMIPMCIIGAVITQRTGSSADMFVIVWTFVTAAAASFLFKPRLHTWLRSPRKSTY